jgi:capsular exopolysaccharide synthesis family protein
MINNQDEIRSSHLTRKIESFNFREEVEKYLIYWKWFVLGIFLSLIISFLYLRYSPPRFSATSSILIKDNKKAGLSAELEAFKDLGIVGGSSVNNTDNEIEILKSRKIVGKVVDSLELYIQYYVSGRVIETEVYKESSPVKLQLLNSNSLFSHKDTVFFIKIKDSNTFDFVDKDKNVVSTQSFDATIESERGEFKILNTPSKNDIYDYVTIKLIGRDKMIDAYRKRINISPVNKNSSVLKLTLVDAIEEKAEDVLDELIKQYNVDAINDKNQISKKTITFINARIDTIGKQLSIIQDSVKDYKIDKGFTGLPIEVQMSLEALKETSRDIIQAQIQVNVSKLIEEKLDNEVLKYELLPAALGIENQAIADALNAYNTLIIERNKRKTNAGTSNPILLQLESDIQNSRVALLKSLNNITKSLELQLEKLKLEESRLLGRINSIPSNERGFVDIARKQEITSALYQYLLRKKEETDISLAVTVPNAKIIDSAYSTGVPVSPKKRLIYLASILIGFLVPFIAIYIKNLLDTKVHNKQDIESELSLPFLGDVPRSDTKEKVIIGNDVRSSTAEAFRLIRTNLDFMLASNRKQSKSIFVTSTTSGEGKSFISINLAATLALSGQKVLLMGMDLRAPKVTEYLGIPERNGITNYITDEDVLLEDLIFQIPQVKGLDIIASGVIPPNPAELLMTKRVDNLFTIVKQEYDVVIVDTAPVNLVTDTLLISKYADMFMYVVRANYLDKRLLAVPQELYNEKKLPNMAIVLNDTDPKRSYGYGYGGYGYGYVVVEKPWYKKIFSKKS